MCGREWRPYAEVTNKLKLLATHSHRKCTTTLLLTTNYKLLLTTILTTNY